MNTVPAKLREKLEKIVHSWSPLSSVEAIHALTPDASTRTYYRIEIADGPLEGRGVCTSVAMCFDSLISPEYEGEKGVAVDEAYVQLTALFRHHDVPVPEIYYDAKEQGVILLEDVGDRLLAPYLIAAKTEEERALANRAYEEAIAVLSRIQSIAPEDAGIVGSRRFSHSAYLNEMLEFLDFMLKPLGVDGATHDAFTKAAQELANELVSLPLVCTHRDFHGWNLLLDATDSLRVIDFQDALLAPRAYDLVGLLHDRDIDSALGRETYERLLMKAVAAVGGDSRFFRDFALVALQRDLKVAGRFAKLSAQGLERYALWIPGTVRRIGRVLEKLSKESERCAEPFIYLVVGNFKEAKQGFEEGSWF